jgi:hypothetical protein
MTWSRVIGLVFVGSAAWILYKGHFVTSDDYGSRDLVDRNKTPFWYWFSVIVQFVIGAVLAIGLVSF